MEEPPLDNREILKWWILQIDDDEEDFLITHEMLNKAQGRKVILDWAPTYQDGLKRLQSNHYDVVLVDYELGDLTGIDFIREAVSQGCRAPLILYTSRGSYEIDVEAMKAGATLYLTKTEANPLLLERFIRYAIERKRNEQERTDILESIQDGFFTLDRDWRFTYLNQKAAQISGVEAEAIIGKNIWELHPKLLGTELERCYRQVMDERKSVKFEMQGIYEGPWFAISVYPFIDGISIYWQDITGKKQIEEELREREERYRVVATNFPAVFAQTDQELRYRWIHHPHPDFNLSEVIGKRDDELDDSEYSQQLVALKQKVLKSGVGLRQELSFRRSDGTRTYDMVIEPWCDDQGNVAGVTTAAIDITGHKLAEEVLRDREEMLSMTLSATGAGIWSWDLQADIHEWSDGFYRILGLMPGDVEPSLESLFSLINPEDIPNVRAALDSVIQDKTQLDFQYRIILPDQSIRIVRAISRGFFDVQGQPVRINGIVLDVTGGGTPLP
jgi:two-component system, sensor histidine kinase